MCTQKSGETNWRGAVHATRLVPGARQRQDEEERSRDNEKKKIKREAVLFKRYWSTLEARAKELRKMEDLKRQDDFLEEVYRERISLREDKDAAWDRIEDVVEDERATYVEIKTYSSR